MTRLPLARTAGAALALVLLAAVPAQAVPTREVIDGQVLHLVSVQDGDAMTAMTPGETVTWDVRVSADEPDGEISLELASAVGGTGEFRVSVRGCPSEGRECTTAVLTPTVLAPGEVVPVASQAADQVAWYRIGVALTGDEPARAVLTFTARGHGDEVASDGEAQLPGTGVSPWLPVGLAVVAVAGGLVFARVAAALRRRAGRG